jgi:HEPN domain-containing protein
MTNDRMGKSYIAQGHHWYEALEVIFQKGHWATVVRQAQECVELLLRGALRLVGIESLSLHDVSAILKRERARFPEWFGDKVDRLAAISHKLVSYRGLSFYGDEQAKVPAQMLFDRDKAQWAFLRVPV